MANPLVHTVEAEFHGAANAAALRELHRQKDFNGLLEYALLLAESEASQKSQIKWLLNEIWEKHGLQQWHMNLAAELLRESRP